MLIKKSNKKYKKVLQLMGQRAGDQNIPVPFEWLFLGCFFFKKFNINIF